MHGTGLAPTPRRRVVALVATFTLVASIMAVLPGTALAAASVSGGLTGGNAISLDTTSAFGGTGSWTLLSGQAQLDVTNNGEFNGGTIVVSAPFGFEFQPGSANVQQSSCSGISLSPTTGSSSIQIGITGSNTGPCSITINALQVRPTTTVPTSGVMSVSYTGFPIGANIGGLGSVPGAAARLSFTTPPPSSIGTGAPFPVSVRVSDKFGNQVLSPMPSDVITLAKASGPGGGVFSCASGNPVGTISGTAFFTGCSFNLAGTYTLIATSLAGYTSAVSGSITVGPVVSSSYLQFSIQPGGGLPNAQWAQQPQIVVKDNLNQVITGFSGTVSLSIASGPGAGILGCTGGNSRTFSGGYATFQGCSISLAGTYTLLADTGLMGGPTPATSNSFTIGTNFGDRLAFTQSPSSSATGTLAPNPIVQVTDSFGTPVPSIHLVTLSLAAISGSGSLTCSNNPDFTNAFGGNVTFVGCVVTGSGTFFLQASAPGLLGASSNQFTIGAGSTQVVFTTQPLGANIGGQTPTGTAGVAWSIQPVVAVRNLAGQTITSDFSTQITLSIAPSTPTTGGPGTLTCTGGNTRQVSAGVATFSGCSINTAGTGYQLRATVTSSSTVPIGSRADSLGFNISAAPQVAFSTQPLGASVGVVPTGPAGTPFSIQPVVVIRNAAGQTLTTDFTSRVTLTITPGTPTSGGPGTLTCTGGNAVTVSAGVATFAGCSITPAGTAYQLRATVSTSTTVTPGIYVDSLPFTMTQSAASITLTTYPSVVIWGDPFTATVQFAGGGNHTFTLQRLATPDNGVWQTIPQPGSTFTTDSTGRAVIQYSPRFNGQYKVVFNGDSSLGAGTSNIRTVNVRNLVLLRPQWSGTKTVNVGFTQTYEATVRPVPSGGLPGGVARVEFQFWKLSGSTWVKTKVVIVGLNSSGVGTLKYTWNQSGEWYIRAVTLANPYNFVGSSVVQRVSVK
jgi:hypothetical protein